MDYPGVGPQHCHLKDIKRVEYVTATDEECIDAFMRLSRDQGIIPALESSHAVAHAVKLAKQLPKTETILVNLSGRGDKDVDYVVQHFGEVRRRGGQDGDARLGRRHGQLRVRRARQGLNA